MATQSNRNRIVRPRNPPDPKPRIRSGISANTHDALIKMPNKEKKSIAMTFRGMGCVSSSQVSAPEVIRAAADWEEARKMRKHKHGVKKKLQPMRTKAAAAPMTTSAVGVEIVSDVCCAPGIGFASDAVLMDCVESTRPVAQIRKHRENAARRMAFQNSSVSDSSSAFDINASSSEIVMSRSSLPYGGSLDRYDRFGPWRLDIDNMSYEELLDLSDKIGYVGTGLSKDTILQCLKKTKLPILDSIPLLLPIDTDWKCSICQDEYKAKDETGKLDCGHSYHLHCIKQWLLQKNACPICKATAAP